MLSHQRRRRPYRKRLNCRIWPFTGCGVSVAGSAAAGEVRSLAAALRTERQSSAPAL